MKPLVGMLVVVLLVISGGLYLLYKQSIELNSLVQGHMSETREWSQLVSERFSKQSKWNLDSQAAVESRLSERIAGMTKAIQEAVALSNATKEQLDKQREEAQKEFDKQKEQAANDDAFKPDSDESESAKRDRENDQKDIDEIKATNPEDVAKNPTAVLDKVREIEERYRRLQLESQNLDHEIKNLEREIVELKALEPQTEEIKKKIEEKQKQVNEKKKEKREVEREMKRERMKIKLLQALLRIAALIAFAYGNPTLGMALLAASQSLGELAEDDQEGGKGGGYPPQPPAVPPIGGVEGGDPNKNGGTGNDSAKGTKAGEGSSEAKGGKDGEQLPETILKPSESDVPDNARLAPTTGGGRVYVRIWPRSGKIELSESSDQDSAWREWFTIEPQNAKRVLEGKLHQINEMAKKFIFIDSNGDPFEYEFGRLPDPIRAWEYALP